MSENLASPQNMRDDFPHHAGQGRVGEVFGMHPNMRGRWLKARRCRQAFDLQGQAEMCEHMHHRTGEALCFDIW